MHSRVMIWSRRIAFAIELAVALVATVWLFLHFDHASHSASDTLRPFLIVALPLWVITIGVAKLTIRHS